MLSLIAIALVTTAALSLTNATPLAPRAPKAVPIILGGNKKSANLFSATSQQTEIVYQADDISLQLVTVHGPPTDFSRAGDPATILVAGRARPGTPLAIAEDGDAGQVSVRCGVHSLLLRRCWFDLSRHSLIVVDRPMCSTLATTIAMVGRDTMFSN